MKRMECSCKLHCGKKRSLTRFCSSVFCPRRKNGSRICFIRSFYHRNNENAYRSLFLALQEGRSDDVKDLILSYPSLRNDELYETILLQAINRGMLCIVEWLINLGIDMYTVSSAFPYASNKGNASAIEMLFLAGADVNSKDKSGKTALHKAAERGDSRIVSVLLKFGADVSVEDTEGRTPLHCAVRSCDLHSITVLVNAGARLDVLDNNGCTLLHEATKPSIKCDGNSTERPKTTYCEMINLLLEKTPNIKDNIKSFNRSGNTCLHNAVKTLNNNNLDIIKRFVDTGAPINILNRDGLTPLRISILRREISVCTYVLNLGADVDARALDGSTALHAAVKLRDEKLVLLLLEYGAEVDAVTSDGITSFHMALYWPSENVTSERARAYLVNILIEFGADIFHSAGYRPNPFTTRVDFETYDFSERGLKLFHYLFSVIIYAVTSDKTLTLEDLVRSENLIKLLYIRCRQEINLLKNSRIGNICLYELLICRNKAFVKYLGNEDLMNFLSYTDSLSTYYVYGPIIAVKYKRAVKRQKLLNSAKTFFNRLLEYNEYPFLPQECIEIILHHLNDHYLNNMSIILTNDKIFNKKPFQLQDVNFFKSTTVYLKELGFL